MVIVELKGGLGNQMFQYAIGKALSTKNNTKLYLDLDYLLDRTPRENFIFRNYDLDVFQVSSFDLIDKKEKDQFLTDTRSLKNRIRNRLFSNGKHILWEKSFSFDKSVFDKKGLFYLKGYWQSPKYFESIENSLREEFQIKFEISEKGKKLINEIENTNSICLNVRRTDFVNLQSSSNMLGFVGLDYYRKASDLIAEKLDNTHFYIFSDDIEWCRNNFQFLDKFPVFFVDHSYKGTKFSEYLNIMSKCKHYIIPNSTFAWWGAWLSTNKDKIVITPKPWFNIPKREEEASDLIPESWVRLEK